MCSTEFPTSTVVFAYDPWPYILKKNFRKIVGRISKPFKPEKNSHFDYKWADDVVKGELFEDLKKLIKPDIPNVLHIDREWIEENFSNKFHCLHAQHLKQYKEKRDRYSSAKNFLNLAHPWHVPSDEGCLDATSCGYFSRPAIMVSQSVECHGFLEKILDGYRIFIVDMENITQEQCTKIGNSFRTAQQLGNTSTSVYLAALINCEIEIRTGRLGKCDKGVYLDRDSYVAVTTDRKYCQCSDDEIIYITIEDYADQLFQGDCFNIGPDICLRICHILSKKNFVCIVMCGGLLLSDMIVNLPKRIPKKNLEFNKKARTELQMTLNKLKSEVIILSSYSKELVEKIQEKNNKIIILETIPKHPEDLSHFQKNITGYYIPELEEYTRENFFIQMIQKRKLLVLADHIKVPRFDINVKELKKFDQRLLADLHKYNCEYMIAIVNDTLPLTENHLTPTLKSILILRCFTKVIVILENKDLVKALAIFGELYPFVYEDENEFINSTWQDELENYLKFGIKYAKILSFYKNDMPFIFLFPSKQDTMSCDMWKVLRNKE